ncbi:MAG: putative metal-dependent hydrolase [Bacteroidia bacterium]|nr:putative metal-dependent hydrolase [Bacteroidia bacterium]
MKDQSKDPLYKLRFPIGQFSLPKQITNDLLAKQINTLDAFPAKLKSLVSHLSDDQLDTAYRSDGWTIRQVIHHVADSHAHSYIRFKWALTEDKPVIKYYYEDRWAELPDGKDGSIDASLMLLTAIHSKLVTLLKGMTEEEFNREFIHPEHNKTVKLKENVCIYAWHCNHHYAHIENCLKVNSWL